jgi:C_GCAxxG_C_C family probable redox protein
MIESVSRRSGELFQAGLFCAESVLLAIAESKGIQSEFIPKIATGFCAGVSRTCGMCGAVSDAILAIGLFKGRSAPEEDIMPTYRTVQRLLQEFEAQFGSTNCRDLVGCDLGTDEGQDYFKKNIIREKCIRLTEGATAVALRLIEEHPEASAT